MSGTVLVVNAGSSSLKFALYGFEAALPVLLRGSISRLATAPRLELEAGGEAGVDRALGAAPIDAATALRTVFAELDDRGLSDGVAAVGHRIVHGGQTFVSPARLDADALAALRRLVPLAPLHQPFNLAAVEHAAERFPRAVQVGCFDTAFHAERPWLDRLYGLPRELTEEGIIAYGFHGLSYAHVAGVLRRRDGERAGGRAIVAHLGSGASLCAMQGGRSVATTMGFSALDGIVMSSRCGSLDPGVILHLLTERRMSAEALTRLLYAESGLLGMSGISGDMQTLLASADPRAGEAVELFVYRIGRAIGSLAAALGGLDTLIFTGGIGENATAVRQGVGSAAAWLGVRIDPDRNRRGEERISADDSTVDVLVVPADEEAAVAAAALALAGGG